MSKHDSTLAEIFAVPTRAEVKWDDIVALLGHLGASITEGVGSRVRVLLKRRIAVFHRPHWQPDTDNGELRSVRRFLTEAGIST